MRRSLEFEQEENGRWYAVLPEWEGEKAELEMVMGADLMLNIIAQGEKEVHVVISDEPIDNADTLTLVEKTPVQGGGVYLLNTWKGVVHDQLMWLCAVTNYVFDGELPTTIWII